MFPFTPFTVLSQTFFSINSTPQNPPFKRSSPCFAYPGITPEKRYQTVIQFGKVASDSFFMLKAFQYEKSSFSLCMEQENRRKTDPRFANIPPNPSILFPEQNQWSKSYFQTIGEIPPPKIKSKKSPLNKKNKKKKIQLSSTGTKSRYFFSTDENSLEFDLTPSFHSEYKKYLKNAKKNSNSVKIPVVPPLRITIPTSMKAFKNHVQMRNARRRSQVAIRGIFLPHAKRGHDYVIVVKPSVLDAPFPTLVASLRDLLSQLSLFTPNSQPYLYRKESIFMKVDPNDPIINLCQKSDFSWVEEHAWYSTGRLGPLETLLS